MDESKPEPVPGCGITTSGIMNSLRKVRSDQYERAIVRIPKAKREAALDGFRDGQTDMLFQLQAMGIIAVVDGD